MKQVVLRMFYLSANSFVDWFDYNLKHTEKIWSDLKFIIARLSSVTRSARRLPTAFSRRQPKRISCN